MMKLLRHGRRRRGTYRLPMTSMIDVVFLLLIFFMVTSTMTPSESQLASGLRAQRASGGQAADFQPQIVDVKLVSGQPAFVLGARVFRSREDLAEVLKELPKEGGVFIRGSSQVPVWAPAAAIQAAKDAGYRKVSYVPAG